MPDIGLSSGKTEANTVAVLVELSSSRRGSQEATQIKVSLHTMISVTRERLWRVGLHNRGFDCDKKQQVLRALEDDY